MSRANHLRDATKLVGIDVVDKNKLNIFTYLIHDNMQDCGGLSILNL